MNIPYTLSELQRVGLTQTQIGAELGLSQSTISDMAAGKAGTKRPSYQAVSGLQRLATLHKVATSPPSETQPQ
jgi:predicted transcriptional regulator